MQDPITEIERLFKDCMKHSSPSALADLRIELTYQLGRLGKMLPDAQIAVAEVEKREVGRYLALRREKMPQIDAKATAKWELAEDVMRAEREYTLFRQYLANGSEMLNAISSKLRTLELEAKNQA